MRIRSFRLILSVLVGTTFVPAAAAQTTFTVNSTADPGDGTCDASECTYREALEAANATAGADTIAFNIPGDGPHTIAPSDTLPDLTERVRIDGYTQPGSALATPEAPATLMIELSGTNTDSIAFGIVLFSDSSVVRGLTINDFGRSGIAVFSSCAGCRIEGNHIGTNVAASTANGNGFRSPDGVPWDGVSILGVSNLQIGGTTPEARNVISGNAYASVYIEGGGAVANVVEGNYLGTNATGTQALGNGFGGIVLINAEESRLGGTEPGAGNLISGNNGLGGIVVGSFEEVANSGARNVIQGNFIGTNAAGTDSLRNRGDGILINTSDNLIGGIEPGARNLISGNRAAGVQIVDPDGAVAAIGNRVQGNFIGTDATGTQPLGNQFQGVAVIDASGNLIGGTESGARNLISGNFSQGVRISEAEFEEAARDNQIQGNYVGTDVTGTQAIANGFDGVAIRQGASNNLIGGTEPGAGNLLSGNTFAGVYIFDPNTTGNRIEGNWIGTSADGSAALGNQDAGIDIWQSTENVIGGTEPGASNVIAHNALAGVNITLERPATKRARLREQPRPSARTFALTYPRRVRGTAFDTPARPQAFASSRGSRPAEPLARLLDDGEGNAVRGNQIFNNGGPGIDLGQDGPTANDAGDPDSGANKLQNTPELTVADGDGGSLALTYTVQTTADNATYPLQIEFFVASEDDEGEALVGTDSYADATVSRTVTLVPEAPVTAGARLVATATDAEGNTSEFSAPIAVTGTAVANESVPDPTAFRLEANYPNPVASITTVRYSLAEPGPVTLRVFDALGRVVARPLDGVPHAAGSHALGFDASRLPSGSYVIELRSGTFRQVRHMLVVR